MGKILDAADSTEAGRRTSCDLERYLDSLDDEGRSDMAEVFRRAQAIPLGRGRWSYIGKVIEKAGGPRIDRHGISEHVRGVDKCRTS